MASPVRQSVDLSGYPDMIVIYLGFRVSGLRGLRNLMKIGRGFRYLQAHPPEGQLASDTFLFGLRHFGIRQYWRDLESLEAFTRSDPHAGWWRDFGKNAQGAGFWHETYRASGGFEAVYLNMPPTGFGRFAPPRTPVGPFMTARQRLEQRPG
jgi:hypothetical protein